MSPGEKYLTAAYVVFLAIVLIYVVIMVKRLGGLERDLEELRELAAERDARPEERDAA
ncbi:MAG TPA: hypothetical protein VF587_14845 [Solirubrobacteraceae bacterium]|jgi:type II secretory pathway component PulM